MSWRSWVSVGMPRALPTTSNVWREALRVLKPGGHLLAFGGTRTWHRLAVAIEDAGFEVRDSIAWMYGERISQNHWTCRRRLTASAMTHRTYTTSCDG
jgi:DNA modification methylase